MVKRIAAIGFIYVCTALAWLILGQVIQTRTVRQDTKLKTAVSQLWGTAQTQQAPVIYWLELITELKPNAKGELISRTVEKKRFVNLAASRVEVDLFLEHRRKGLLWYSTYQVRFASLYTLVNPTDHGREFYFDMKLPASNAVYDHFNLNVDGRRIAVLPIHSGHLIHPFHLEPGQKIPVELTYRSQGLDQWRYSFGDHASQVMDFEMVMRTDFASIDFPLDSMSPTSKTKNGDGWTLEWQYDNLLTGVALGMLLPVRLNPGPWVEEVVYAAPISLFLFFFLLFIFSTVRRLELHPMHYFFVGSAFFSFHLLLAYLVDHLLIHYAFAIASAVSIFLVTTYMRLVLGTRLAFVEIGLSQFIYLVLFSYTFFFIGYTGLSITILCIVTLFATMQFTGRVDWSAEFKKREDPPD